MAAVPTRRDAAGVDKAADISESLRRIPIVAGRLVTVEVNASGLYVVPHGLGRKCSGGLLAGGPAAHLGAPTMVTPAAAAQSGVDSARFAQFLNQTNQGSAKTFEFWVF